MMKIIWKLLLCFFLLVSIASATDLSYIDTGDYILFDRGDGLYINLTGQQNFSEFNFTAPILNITINNSYSIYNNTANLTLSSVSYSNDKLNFTGSATSGILNISAKMSNISTYYHLFIDDIKNTSVISDTVGVVNYVWSSWSSHLFSIQENMAPTISNVTNHTINENITVYVDIDGSDANGDTLTFSTNRSDLFTDFNSTTGKGNWTTNFSSSGTYYIDFGVSDGYNATNETMTITVTNIPLTITAFQPSSDPSSTQGTSQAFNVTLNRTANVTWYMNGTQMQVNQSVTIANYTNATAGIGTWNVTATATDGIDTVNKQWNWTINSANLINFTFTNQSISESQIYQSSQATQIKVDVNDSDGFLTNVSVGITYNGFETNYSMTGGNDTWSYNFKSGVAGSYTITHFYATDNASGTNSTTSTLSFVVVPGLTGGVAPATTPKPTTTVPTPINKLQTKITTTLPQEIGNAKSGIEAIQQAINTIERQPFERKAIAGIFILLIFMYSENLLWDRRQKK